MGNEKLNTYRSFAGPELGFFLSDAFVQIDRSHDVGPHRPGCVLWMLSAYETVRMPLGNKAYTVCFTRACRVLCPYRGRGYTLLANLIRLVLVCAIYPLGLCYVPSAGDIPFAGRHGTRRQGGQGTRRGE